MAAEPITPRPWWACALVPVYLAIGYGLLLLWYSALIYYLAFYMLLLFVATVLVAAVLLTLTRRSPWLSPPLDALLAVGVALPIASTLLCFTLISFRN